MPAPHRRRWFQFGIKHLLCAMALLSVPLWYVSSRYREAVAQRDFTEMLQRHAAMISFEPGCKSCDERAGNLEPRESFLAAVREYRPLTGIRFVDFFSATRSTDGSSCIAQVVRLPELEYL